jgi:1,4-alpha-glucan branching enzyme
MARWIIQPGIQILSIVLCLSALEFGCATQSSNGLKKAGIPVTFSYTGNHRSVCLSGDFNDWSQSQCLKRRKDGVWTIRIFLEPGRYRYGYILDGERRVPDPHNLLEEDDGFGNRNSILILE